MFAALGSLSSLPVKLLHAGSDSNLTATALLLMLLLLLMMMLLLLLLLL